MDDLDQKLREYIYREYPELAGARLSIGERGKHVRVIATDQFDVVHTLKLTLADTVQ